MEPLLSAGVCLTMGGDKAHAGDTRDRFDGGNPLGAKEQRMTIVQRMRDRLRESMKARDTVQTQFLRYWIAQLTLGDGSEVADHDAVKKMRSVLKEAKGGQTTFLPEELEFLKDWVPPTLSPDQVERALAPVAEQIRGAAKEGMAMGIAMKALAGQPVESDDVKLAITKLRQ